jgi:hypothetical protein
MSMSLRFSLHSTQKAGQALLLAAALFVGSATPSLAQAASQFINADGSINTAEVQAAMGRGASPADIAASITRAAQGDAAVLAGFMGEILGGSGDSSMHAIATEFIQGALRASPADAAAMAQAFIQAVPPSQAPSFVQVLVAAAPASAAMITQVAVQTVPSAAAAIAAAAVTAAPEAAAAIVQAAVSAAPAASSAISAAATAAAPEAATEIASAASNDGGSTGSPSPTTEGTSLDTLAADITLSTAGGGTVFDETGATKL